MNIDTQKYLDLVEVANKIAFVDIEATGLNGDYNSVLVVSIKSFKGDPETFLVDRPGIDKDIVDKAVERLYDYDTWVTYYGRGFDVPMLETRRLRWRLPAIKRHEHGHLDLYFSLKYKLNTSRKSQSHLLSWLGIKEEVPMGAFSVKIPEQSTPLSGGDIFDDTQPQKMTVSAEVWNLVLAYPKKFMPVMVKRCESDVVGLQSLYQRTRHLMREVKRG